MTIIYILIILTIITFPLHRPLSISILFALALNFGQIDPSLHSEDYALVLLLFFFLITVFNKNTIEIPIVIKRILFIWIALVFINFIISLNYQTFYLAIRSYRLYFWLFSPIYLIYILNREKMLYDFLSIMLIIAWLTSILFIFHGHIVSPQFINTICAN